MLQNALTLHRVTPRRLADARALHGARLAALPIPRIAVIVGGPSGPYAFGTRAGARLGRQASAMAAALGNAGCVEAWIGAESGSQRILDAMNKDTSIEELVAARRRLGEHGIRVGFFIQLGYLGERLQDLLATRELVAHAAPDDIGVSVSYPLPGTRFHEQVKGGRDVYAYLKDDEKGASPERALVLLGV